MKRKPTSPRRPKPKKCAEYRIGDVEASLLMLVMNDKAMLDALCRALDRYQWAYDGIAGTLMDLRYSNGLLSQNHAEKEVKLTAERDEARKQHLVATTRNAELTNELRKLQAFKDLALGLAQRDLAGNLHIKAEDVTNCLQ